MLPKIQTVATATSWALNWPSPRRSFLRSCGTSRRHSLQRHSNQSRICRWQRDRRRSSRSCRRSVDRYGTNRIIDTHLFKEQDGEDYQDTCDRPNDYGIRRANKGTRGCNCDQTSQHAVAEHRWVWLHSLHTQSQVGRKGSKHTRQHRVDDDDRDAEVRTAQRATSIKTKPAKGEDERPKDNHRNVVTRDRLWLAVLELANPRSDHNRTDQPDDTAHGMDDTRACEIDCPMAQPKNLPVWLTNRRPRPSEQRCSKGVRPIVRTR